VIKEDKELRGRAPSETARLLAEGLAEGGTPPDRVEIVLDEIAAIDRGLQQADPDDLVVIFADEVHAVLEHLNSVPA